MTLLLALAPGLRADDSLDTLSGLERPAQLLEQSVRSYQVQPVYCHPPDSPNKAEAEQQLNSLRTMADNHRARLNAIRRELGNVLNTSSADDFGGTDTQAAITRLRGRLARINGMLSRKRREVAAAPDRDCSPPLVNDEPSAEISTGETGVATSDSDYDIPPDPQAEPVNIPDIPAGPICPEDKEALVQAAYDAVHAAGRNARAWDSVVLALHPPLQNAIVNEPGQRAYWQGRLDSAIAAREPHLRKWDEADAALAAAKAVPTKVCAELDPRSRKLIYMGDGVKVGRAGGPPAGGRMVTTPNGSAVSIPAGSGTQRYCDQPGAECEKDKCQEIQLPSAAGAASVGLSTATGRSVKGQLQTTAGAHGDSIVSMFRDVTAEDFYFGRSVSWSGTPLVQLSVGHGGGFELELPDDKGHVVTAGNGWESTTEPITDDPPPGDITNGGGNGGGNGGSSSGGNGGGSSGGGNGGDDPRDTPPPVIYGEEEDDLPLGILLVRDDKDWLPKWQGRTTVTARLYVKHPPGIWVPANKQARIITVKFNQRSTEKGMSLNRDIGQAPEDSPDLFMPTGSNQHSRCSEDPSGKGYLFGTCTTKKKVTQQQFAVYSEDYGSFSRMEASCAGCEQLKPPGGWLEGLPPVALSANALAREHLVTVPMDNNDNQIADNWLHELPSLQATEDEDDLPKGNGVKGDGFSAYEEYRGIHARGKHTRMNRVRKSLLIDNSANNYPLGLFRQASKLSVHDVKKSELRDRVANFNSGHANVVEQHGVIIKPNPSTPAGRVSSITDLTGDIDYANIPLSLFGVMIIGPPRNVNAILIDPRITNNRMLEATVAHELGHASCIRHHGEGRGYTTYKTIDTPGSNTLSTDRSAQTVSFPFAQRMTLCRRFVSPRYGIKVGEKHNSHSGHTDCIMRYLDVAEAYFQGNGSLQCVPFIKDPQPTLLCDAKTGGYNAGNQVAGNAVKGNCEDQLMVNDG